MLTTKTIAKLDLEGLKLFRRGKVRDVYDLGDELLLISTDRISCFDVVLNDCIPFKGQVLTLLSIFWFGYTKDVITNHFITADVDKYPAQLRKYKDDLRGRSMLTKKAKLIPFECVVRGYLSGSGWKEYQQSQTICGIPLPAGLKESDKLPEPIFTPSTKEDTGHDQNISPDLMMKAVGEKTFKRLKEASIGLYQKASAFAESKGIIIADTKFEFGFLGDDIILIDEVLTPDSSRFWPMDKYKPGRGQPSFDKQFVRDYLETLDWDKTYPAPALPSHVVEETTRKYLDICRLLVGENLSTLK